ncbi:MAG: competence/damage-inducible protein A [Phycisphaerales bacterium]
MPDPHRTATILAIGDELTLGQTLDTNSRLISQRLSELGVMVIEHATVEDDLNRIVSTLTRLANESDLLVVTGGLGPTADDLTRDALARAMGDTLVPDDGALDDLDAWFARKGRSMPERNRVQAMRPSRARCLRNEHGTAPGLAAQIGACAVWCLPGPPHELVPMFEREIAPNVRPEEGRVILTRTLPTFGLGESLVAERLGELMDRDRMPMLGTTASKGVVTCRLRYDAKGTAEDAARALDSCEAVVRDRLGHAVLRAGGASESLVEVVAGLLRERGETVCTVESCTGGLLGAALTDLAGSSEFYAGGFVTYSNELKTKLVGVDPRVLESDGAVSAPVARAMATGGLDRTGADHALAITGVAGPDGGSADKPVGTVWIARASQGGPADVRRFLFSGDRAAVRNWSWRTALGMLRLTMIDADMPLLGEMERAD